MPTKIAVSHSIQTNSKAAAIEAAQNALKNAGIEKADFAFAYCSGKHNPYDFLSGIHSVLGETPLIGGSTIGIITDQFIGYEGYEAGVTVIASDTISFTTFAVPDLNKGEKQAGILLGKQIQEATTQEENALIVLYDSSKQQNPPMLNFATWLFEGLETHLPQSISCAGGGLLSDMQLTTTYQFHNNHVLTQNAVAVLMGGCKMETTILHGCKPASSYLKITKAEGPIIYEIDHRPALELIDELLGNDHRLQWKDFSLFVTLGVNKGEKFGPFIESDYANRLVLSVDINNKSLIMFEPDLKTGDEVQLMQRSFDLKYIESGLREIRKNEQQRKYSFAFYIDCAGRAKPYTGEEIEDAEEVQKGLKQIPFMGIYSGVEIAKINNKLQPLDWTGVLCMISE